MTDRSEAENENEKPFPPGGDTTFFSYTTGTKRTFLPGDLVDNSYRLTSILGQGGMGVVFACHHEALGRDYALKLLKGDQLSGEFWSRFQAEAQALAKLNHPGIVGIYNMGLDAGQYPFFVMDLLSGETLDLLIREQGRLSVNEALDCFIQVSDALSSAHSQGIVHRDIKPSNIMLVRDDHNKITAIKLVDFGIARLSRQGFAVQSQTATGLVFGTPFYMSPEQCQGLRVDERSDIYSLGCTIFEALTGRPPFRGDKAFHTFVLHQTATPPSLASIAPQGNFPEALERVVAKMLAKNLSERYQTMAHVKQELERVKAGKTVMARGPGRDSPQSMREESKAGNSEDKQSVANRPGSAPSKVVLSVLAASLVLSGVGWGLYQHFSVHSHSSDPGISKAKSKFNMVNTDDTIVYDAITVKEDEKIAIPRLNAYFANPRISSMPLKQRNPPGFEFPKDFMLGAIRFGEDTPLQANGFLPCPPGKRVCLYLTKYTDTRPELLDRFGPDDLNGLEIKIRDPGAVIRRVSKWRKLDELSFFNSLTKALKDENENVRKEMDNESQFDESPLTDQDLLLIDKLTNLKTLGLCGPRLHGEAIAKMHLLNTLHSLKLKRVSNIQKVLDVLSTKDNLKELWLIAQDTTDAQVEDLTSMKNLETLKILRGRLTTASLSSFKKMPALKHLYLDQIWSDLLPEQLQKELPSYVYEPTHDSTYWKMFPDPK